VLVVIENFETPAALSFRNLAEVQLIKAGELNAYDVLCNDWIVFEAALLPTADTSAPDGPAVEAEPAPVAEHAEDPAEGPRDDADDNEEGDSE
jgi:large subunit ribosomal protein L4